MIGKYGIGGRTPKTNDVDDVDALKHAVVILDEHVDWTLP